MYLLDTNIVSALRRNKPHGAVLVWLEAVDASDVYLSVVTLAEIQAGIEITREHSLEKANELEVWLDLVAQSYNILPMDSKIYRTWAQLMHRKSDTLYRCDDCCHC